MKKLLNKLSAFDVHNIELDKKKIFFIILFCLIIVYLDFSFLMKMQIKTFKDLGGKITKLKVDYDSLNRDLAEMQGVKNKQAQIPDGFFSQAKRIISEEEVVSLLQDISEMAKKNNVQIAQMKPYNEPRALQNKTTANKFTPVLIALDLTSDYHSLGGFINDLENGQTFICVQELKIASQQKDNLKQKANLLLKTHVRTYAKK